MPITAPADGEAILGLQCKLYYGTAGASATTLFENVRDVNIGLDKAEEDTTSRKSDGWETTVPTTKKGDLTFNILNVKGDAEVDLLIDAWLNGTPLAFQALDGAIGVGKGLDADFAVINLKHGQPIKGVSTWDVTLKITTTSRAPTWQPGS